MGLLLGTETYLMAANQSSWIQMDQWFFRSKAYETLPVLTYVRNGNTENALHSLLQLFLFLFIASILCGCGSFSARSSADELEGSEPANESPQAKEEKLIPESRFLHDLTYQKSILSACSQKIHFDKRN